MAKVAPQNSFSVNDIHRADEEEEQLSYEIEDEHSEKIQKRKPLICQVLYSVRLFLILIIISLVILTSFSIWITSYKVNQEQALRSVDVLILNIREKVSNYLTSQLSPAKTASYEMAQDYHNFYVSVDNGISRYLLSKVNLFNVTLANLGLGENGLNLLQTITIEETKNLMIWVTNNPGENFTTYVIDRVTGNKIRDYGLVIPNYSLSNTGAFRDNINMLKTFTGGCFGAPYQVIGSSIQIFYITPLYNRTNLSTKQVLGTSKVNISLKLIASFLSNVEVLDRGFVIVAEEDTDLVIGTSLEVDLLYSRIPTVNLTSKGAGKIMKKAYQLSNKAEAFQVFVYEGGQSYLVSSSIFRYENIKWRMTLVFEEGEIMVGIIESSYTILGVSIFLCIIGIIISIIVGFIVSHPLKQLEKDFKKIELLDLANIKPRKSIFSENSNIYSKLTTTVQWLRDFKSFLPDTVLNQLEKENKNTKMDYQSKGSNYKADAVSENNLSAHEINESQSSTGKFKDSSRNNQASTRQQQREMFKLGLSVKECCVLNVKLNNMNDKYFSDPDVLSQTVSKVLTNISTICKTVKADLQIKSYDEFVIIFADRPQVSNIGLETALKMVQGISHLNNTLSKSGSCALSLSIGIASGDSLQGNVGNKQTRYFALVGTVIERSRDLCFLSSVWETPILVDQTTYKHGKQFVFRPVDRYLDTHSLSILTVYELVKKNIVDQDEWLYELEQKKQNSKYVAYNDNFERLFNMETVSEVDLEIIRENLHTITKESPADRVAKRMLNLSQHHAQFTNYHSSVSKVVKCFLDMNHETPIHID